MAALCIRKGQASSEPAAPIAGPGSALRWSESPLTIGDGAVIAGACVVTADVAERALIKAPVAAPRRGSRRSRSQPRLISNSYSGSGRFEIARHRKLRSPPPGRKTERPSTLGPDKFKLNGNSSITPESVSAAIFRAVDTLNETLAKTQQL